ncbi:MAG: hypothetical protein ACYTAN_04560 [Planctomycetota bacterium]|jgi:hypothetical protein
MNGKGRGKSKRRRERERLRLEPLEERIAPAGGITAAVKWGNLVITGDADDNAIYVDNAGIGAGEYRITSGMDPTQINGQAGPLVFTGVTEDLRISMGDGDDTVEIDQCLLPGSLRLDGGDGNNEFYLGGVGTPVSVTRAVSVRNGDGNDTFEGRLVVASAVRIANGDGGSSVLIEGDIGRGLLLMNGDGTDALVFNGHSGGPVRIINGTGDSSSHLTGVLDRGVIIRNGAGNDTVVIDADVTGNATVDNGDGDSLAILLGHVTGSVTVRARTGDDSVVLQDLIVDNRVFISTGNGNTGGVALDTVSIAKGVTVRAGAANNTFIVDDSGVGNMSVTHGDGAGVTDIEGSILGRVRLRHGTGDATVGIVDTDMVSLLVTNRGGNTGVALGLVDVFGNVSIRNLAGNDTLAINNTGIQGALTVSNGHGDSQTTIDDSMVFGRFFLRNLNGQDQLAINDADVFNSVTVANGHGPTLISITRSELGYDLTGRAYNVRIRNGDENDLLNISEGNFGGSLIVHNGKGQSQASLNMLIVEKNVRLKSTDSADTWDMQAILTGGRTSIDTGDDIDVVLMDDIEFWGPVNIRTGNGNDTVAIEITGDALGSPSYFDQGLLVNTGNDNDDLIIGVAGQAGNSAQLWGRVILDGGRGGDDLDILTGGNTFNDGYTERNFETVV